MVVSVGAEAVPWEVDCVTLFVAAVVMLVAEEDSVWLEISALELVDEEEGSTTGGSDTGLVELQPENATKQMRKTSNNETCFFINNPFYNVFKIAFLKFIQQSAYSEQTDSLPVERSELCRLALK